MREPPEDLDDATVVNLVRGHWDAGIDAVEHLAVGFGAHHWAAYADGCPRLFVTYDTLTGARRVDELESTYAAAAVLASQGLEFVHPCLLARSGSVTAPVAAGALSVTRWVDGTPGGGPAVTADETDATARMLRRLHAASPPAGARCWQPLPDVAGWAAELPGLVARPWDAGPYGEQARAAVTGHLDDVARWSARYDVLAGRTLGDRDGWVVTHGEPHTGNQLVTDAGRLLVDWESLRLAPRERDLRTLSEWGFGFIDAYGSAPDWSMVELFDLEWRLFEVMDYTCWLSAAHTGTESDAVALGGLLEELGRADWHLRARDAGDSDGVYPTSRDGDTLQ